MRKFVFYIGSLGLYEVIQAANVYDARQKLRSGFLYRFLQPSRSHFGV